MCPFLDRYMELHGAFLGSCSMHQEWPKALSPKVLRKKRLFRNMHMETVESHTQTIRAWDCVAPFGTIEQIIWPLSAPNVGGAAGGEYLHPAMQCCRQFGNAEMSTTKHLKGPNKRFLEEWHWPSTPHTLTLPSVSEPIMFAYFNEGVLHLDLPCT